MKACNKCGEMKPFEEFYKASAARDGLQSSCKSCIKSAARERHAANPEKNRAADKKRYAANREKRLATNRKWHKDNPGKARAAARERHAANPEKARAAARDKYAANPEKYRKAARDKYAANPEKILATNKKWAAGNPGKVRAKNAKRRAAKLFRTPSWSETEAIEQFYIDCPKGYQGDHEIPLQGELVSGLHVLENLQYLTGPENISKGNKFNPDDWYWVKGN